MKTIVPLVAIVASSLFWTGCVSYPTSAAMTPRSLEIKNHSHESVSVSVEGQPTLTLERQPGKNIVQIPHDAFTEALCAAIQKSALFAKIDSASPDFKLDVQILGYNPPRFSSLDMTAEMTTHWKLTRLKDGKVVFDDFIKKQHTCTLGDAFVGGTRWRKANEGVARDTIAGGIQRMSEVFGQSPPTSN